MSAPVWIASPPEVHSALLSTGPGPGALLSTAAAWTSLSAEYAAVAEELAAVLGGVQGGAWEGPSAEQYVGAHLPYLAWLMQASTTSVETAARHETVAGAYTTALAVMPTLAELAANHATHGVLVATNFFGINTIPITLNEADYVRMWIQAATTMSVYQGVSDAELASVPQVTPAPQILDSGTGTGANEGLPDPTVSNPVDTFIADVLRVITGGRVIWDPASGTVNGLPYDAYVNAGQPIFWIVRALELFEDFQQFGVYLVQNPALAVQYLVSLEAVDWPTHILEIATWLSQSPQLLAATLGAAVANLGAVAGFAGLAGLAGIPAPPAAPALAPAVASTMVPPVGTASPVAVSATAPASAPVPAPAASTVAGAGPTPPPPAAGGTGGFGFPYAIPPPGIGFGSGMSASASAGAKKKASEPDSAASAAAAAAREQTRARRRRRATRHTFGDEYLDMDVEVDPEWGAPPGEEAAVSGQASDQGAQKLGFAGTLGKEAVAEAAGLTRLASDEFGGGPRMPMVPGTWDSGGGGERTAGPK